MIYIINNAIGDDVNDKGYPVVVIGYDSNNVSRWKLLSDPNYSSIAPVVHTKIGYTSGESWYSIDHEPGLIGVVKKKDFAEVRSIVRVGDFVESGNEYINQFGVEFIPKSNSVVGIDNLPGIGDNSDSLWFKSPIFNRVAITPIDFGAIGDGNSHPLSERYQTLEKAQEVYPFVTSLSQEIDWAAIVKMVMVNRPSHSTFNVNQRPYVEFSLKGRFYIGNSGYIPLYSFQGFSGTGIIKANDSYTGEIISLREHPSESPNDMISHISINGARFEGSSATAIKVKDNTLLLNSSFTRIDIATKNGLKSDFYTQFCTFSRIYNGGAVNQILKLAGNANEISWIDKEGSTTHGSDPYIHIKGHHHGKSSQNKLSNILIEQFTSQDKVPVLIEDVDGLDIHAYWGELTESNGFGIEFRRASNVNINGALYLDPPPKGRLKVSEHSNVSVEKLSVNATDNPVKWWEYLDVDETSVLSINQLYTRRNEDVFVVEKRKNINVDSYISRNILSGIDDIPVSAISKPKYTSNVNLFKNGGFRNGLYGWVFNAAPDIVEHIDSSFNNGKSLRLGWNNSNNTYYIYQNIDIGEQHIGKVITLTANIRVEGSGIAYPLIAGVYSSGNNRATATGLDTIITATHTIESASSNDSKMCGIMFYSPNGNSRIVLSDLSVSFGESAIIGGVETHSIDVISGQTIIFSDSPPNVGFFKKGSRCFNTNPSSTSPDSWVIITEGLNPSWTPVFNGHKNFGYVFEPGELSSVQAIDGDYVFARSTEGIIGNYSYSRGLKGFGADLIKTGGQWRIKRYAQDISVRSESENIRFAKRTLITGSDLPETVNNGTGRGYRIFNTGVNRSVSATVNFTVYISSPRAGYGEFCITATFDATSTAYDNTLGWISVGTKPSLLNRSSGGAYNLSESFKPFEFQDGVYIGTKDGNYVVIIGDDLTTGIGPFTSSIDIEFSGKNVTDIEQFSSPSSYSADINAITSGNVLVGSGYMSSQGIYNILKVNKSGRQAGSVSLQSGYSLPVDNQLSWVLDNNLVEMSGYITVDVPSTITAGTVLCSVPTFIKPEYSKTDITALSYSGTNPNLMIVSIDWQTGNVSALTDSISGCNKIFISKSWIKK